MIREIDKCLSFFCSEGFEFIVVDDDSPDKTWKLVQDAFSLDPRVTVIRLTGKRNLADAIWQGILQAKGDIVAWLDCDFSMPPSSLAMLIDTARQDYDIAVGSRFIKGGKDFRANQESFMAVVMSRLLNGFISFVLNPSFKDYTSGFVAAKKEVFADIQLKGDYGEYFIGFIYFSQKKGYRIKEIPYQCLPRRSGYSKTGRTIVDFFSKGWKYFAVTLRLRFHL